MEYLGFNFNEENYTVIDNNICANIIDENGKSSICKLFYKDEYYYFFKPTYVDKDGKVELFKRYGDIELKIAEKSLSYFVVEICNGSLGGSSILEYLTSIIKSYFDRTKIIIDIDKKFVINKDYAVINSTFIENLKILDREINNLDKVFNSIKYTKTSGYLFDKKYLKAKKDRKALYQPNLLADLLNSTILAYSDDTIISKLSENDIESMKKSVSKISSVLDFRYIKNIQEKELLKEAITIGEKILKIKREKSSVKTITNIYELYLKHKQFDKFFKAKNKVELEKLWEAYITKYARLIFDVDRSNIDNQFEIKRSNRVYIPDFVITDLYGTKTIIEIKTHIDTVINYDKSHDSLYFSSACNKAIGQLQGYIKKIVLSDNTDKEYFSSAKGLIILGNRHEDQKKNLKDLNIPKGMEPADYYYKSVRDLNSVLINIEIIYFDDLINSMKKRLNRLID